MIAIAIALLLACPHARAPQADPLARLGVWIERARIAPRSIDERRQAELKVLLGDLRLMRADGSADSAALDRELVELASLEWRGSLEGALAASVRMGRAELEGELLRRKAEMARFLARDVLDPEAKQPRERRLLAAHLLREVRAPETLAVLTRAARERDPELAQAATAALSGWPTASAHLFFLDELARGKTGTHAAAEHFRLTADGLDSLVLEGLQAEVARRYLDEDWREAARARELGRALDVPHAVPVLIEALATWERRAGEGKGSKRIRSELVAELQRLSGRALGAEPERWNDWWQAVVAGRVALPAEIAASGGQSSSAAFFGLRASTDRVVFVVDRSGSMRTSLGTRRERSRHAEAIDQVLRFLEQSGEDTRFGVALFGDEGASWRSRLSPATPANLELVRRWLEAKPPEGETRLFEGLRAGLGLDARGHLNLERCEVDTVIVLCDGATSEGPGWAARWLAEENEGAQIVFHCVQIGNQGNGTLEALARGSNGQFVHIPG